MSISPVHATNVPLVLDPSTGSITPKFHVIYDDHFATVTATEEALPDFNSDAWYKMFGDSNLQYHVDDSDNVPHVQPPSNQNASQARTWASDLKYPSVPLESNPPTGISTSLDSPTLQHTVPLPENPSAQAPKTPPLSEPMSPVLAPNEDLTPQQFEDPIVTPTTLIDESEDITVNEDNIDQDSPVTASPTPVLRRSKRVTRKPEQLNMNPSAKSYAYTATPSAIQDNNDYPHVHHAFVSTTNIINKDTLHLG